MIAKVKSFNQKLRGWKRRFFLVGTGGGLVLMILVMIYGGFWSWYRGRVYPGIRVGQVTAAAMKPETLEQQLQTFWDSYMENTWPRTWLVDNQEIIIPDYKTVVQIDIEATVTEALEMGRKGNLKEQLKDQWQGISQGLTVPVKFKIDENWWEETTASMAAKVNVEAVMPTMEVQKDRGGKKTVNLNEGRAGQKAEMERFKKEYYEAIGYMGQIPKVVPIAKLKIEATETELRNLEERANRLLGKSVKLRLRNNEEWELTIEDERLVSWLSLNEVNTASMAAYLAKVAQEVDREPQNAVLKFDESQKRAVEFMPAKDGLRLKIPETVEVLKEGINRLEKEEVIPELEMVVGVIPPTITLETINDLGIHERIGRGYSRFTGSIASRIHNVELAARRINGTLIPPGEVFSFNSAVGEVNAETGYQKAYIIRNGRTELDDGGGVCQVSTTVFRAALDSGLPITERRAHAYRVGYYEQNAKAGLDATVFAPTTDLKFLNDTPAYILVQTITNTQTRELTIDFYGTSDGRVSEILNHTVGSITPPPEDVYQDDPTLPTGTIKQVEHKVAGAKAKFDYKVSRNSEVIYEKTFYSVFKPWASVFLRGTGPQQ